ncbi:MAG: AAA family ATPase [Nanoarchaeota archaeon]|nr:AAA family ATPase [Nanoarchaeota archaeon]MBU4351695.1 AAA family ATPase [Nanoarchaeota archaeon]MBU4456721.1 AAA family ATPase [Nanoarchaeota archaeon]MCG2720059.1 AAA family ATPase [Nanoarchaeota archaeon]
MKLETCDSIDLNNGELIKLRLALAQAEAELERFKQPPLVVCEVKKIIDNKAIVKLANNSTFLVNILPELEGQIRERDHVLAEQRSLSIVRKLDNNIKNFAPESFRISKKPDIKWSEIGGLWSEIQELKEVVELPLKKPGLFKKIGIQPPKGVLLYGPPGCGKTLLAKALAKSTKATFIELVGSELVQKFIGEGSKLVKEVFEMARENAPSIIFIDEIDTIASHRIESGTSAEREVQRTFMQLLAEVDGFKSLDGVKIIGATNRFDILDQALIRPGRLDRLVEIGPPGPKARTEIFKIHTNGMNLKKVNSKRLVELMTGFSGADIRLVCTEAGYFAIRDKRTEVNHGDFLQAVAKVKVCEEDSTEHLKMFG